MAEKEKDLKKTCCGGTKECSLDDLEKVSGGANPFEDVQRVKVHELDEEIREKA